jgi:hypothetical protein
MTEAEWLAGSAMWPMCLSLRDKVSDRKLRLVACAYCRSIRGLMGKASRRAILVGEQMADGPVGEPQREAAVRAAIEAVLRFPSMSGDHFMAADVAYRVACNDGWYAVEWTVGNGPELPGGVRLLRDIVGNPFRPVAVDPRWLTPGVVTLARTIYDERAFDRMASLGAALADSGCTDLDILDHCLGPGEHVRGCWAVDAILGQE